MLACLTSCCRFLSIRELSLVLRSAQLESPDSAAYSSLKMGRAGPAREGWAGFQTNESVGILHTATHTQVIGEASVWGAGGVDQSNLLWH